MPLTQLVRNPNLDNGFLFDVPAKKIRHNIDGVTIVQSAAGVLSAVAEDAAGTAYDNTASGLTATTTQAAIDELNVALTGVAHTSITGIDLAPTGNPNEFTVSITWVDENGATQTTVDPTPITVAGVTVVSADAGNLITAGSDQGAFLDQAAVVAAVTVVSADAGNLATVGTDGGALVTEAAVESALTQLTATDAFGDPIGTFLDL